MLDEEEKKQPFERNTVKIASTEPLESPAQRQINSRASSARNRSSNKRETAARDESS